MDEICENAGTEPQNRPESELPEQAVPVVLDASILTDPRLDDAQPDEPEPPANFDPAPCPPGCIYVLDPKIFHARMQTRGDKLKWSRNSDIGQRMRELLSAHAHLALPYPLASYPSDMADRWQDLRDRYPNFNQVLDILESRYALASLRPDTPVSFPPILLLGEPGVGKSAFSKAVCVAVDIEYGEIPMAGITETFPISGLDLGWSTGGPGRVMEIVSAAGHANPIILLDEIDKCGMGNSGGSPYAPLHILLERHSAANFQDVAFRMPADLSWVNWIATANDPLAIPVSLLSRFRQIEVPSPTREQMFKVVQSIYSSRRETVSNGDLFPPDLDPDVADRLALLTPRQVGLVLEDAMGNAARKQQAGNAPLIITPADVCIPYSRGKPGIGFCNT